MKSLSRREMLKVMGLGGAASVLAACGPKPAPTTDSGADTGDQAEPTAQPAAGGGEPAIALEGFTPRKTNPPEKLKLVYWWGNNYEPATEPTNKKMQRFSEVYPNIEIESVAGQNCDAFVTASAAGTPPDLFHTWDCVERMGSWAKRGMIVALDDYIKGDEFDLDDYLPGVMETCRMDGKTWGMVDSGGLFLLWMRLPQFADINKAVTDRPADTDELWQWAKELTTRDANGEIQRIGFKLPSWNWPRLAWLVNFGGEFWDMTNNMPTPDHPGLLEGLNDLVNQVKEYGVDTLDRWSTSTGAGTGEQYPFLAGTETMELEGDWQYAFTRDTHPEWQIGTDYDIDALPEPPKSKLHGESAVAYWSWPIVVPAGKNADWGWELLRFVLSPEYQVDVHTKYFTEMLSRKSLMNDPRVQYPPTKVAQKLVESQKKWTAVMPMNPVASEYMNLLGEAFDKILHLDETPEAGMGRVKDEVTKKLEELANT